MNWFTAVDYDQYTHVRQLSDVDGEMLDDYFKVFEDGEMKYYRLDEDFVPPDSQNPSRAMQDETLTILEVPVIEEEIIVIPGQPVGATGASGMSTPASTPAPAPAPAPQTHSSTRTIVRSPPHIIQPGPTVVIQQMAPPAPTEDLNGDGVIDEHDIDSDGDGIPDEVDPDPNDPDPNAVAPQYAP